MTCPDGPHLFDIPEGLTGCSFTETAGETICGRPEIWHLLVQPRYRRYSMIFACNEHLPAAGLAVPVLAAHRFLPTECGDLTTVWNTAANRCVPKSAGATE